MLKKRILNIQHKTIQQPNETKLDNKQQTRKNYTEADYQINYPTFYQKHYKPQFTQATDNGDRKKLELKEH